MSYLMKMVNDRMKHFMVDYCGNNKLFFDVWFKTAELMRSEFLEEGLVDTVKELDNIIAEQREIMEREERYLSKRDTPRVIIHHSAKVRSERYDEHVLPDDYPIYSLYTYRIGDKVYISDYHDITVKVLKSILGVDEVRRYALFPRSEERNHLEVYKKD